MNENFNEFNWDAYKDGFTGPHKLVPNPRIVGNSLKDKCFSREPYAQRLFDIYSGQDTKLVKKDLQKGDCVPIIDIYDVRNKTINIELSGGLTLLIDLEREKRFVQTFGYSCAEEFTCKLADREFVNMLLAENLEAFVIESHPCPKVSLWQGYLKNTKEEFMRQIENPTKAYTAKVIQANKGGFFVEVQGVEAFMPGSLAAPNKINDFQSYVGKEVIVMIEDFLKEMNSFIVSHKKYIAHVLPKMIEELDLKNKFSGSITGSSKYGIFIEFNELFTGLLHTSKMSETTKLKFNNREFKAGDKIEFYIAEVTKDQRIILTEESPEAKLEKIQKFVVECRDKLMEGEIAAIMKFGIIVNVGDISGLISIKELRKNNIMINNYLIKDKIKVLFDEIKEERILFKIPK